MKNHREHLLQSQPARKNTLQSTALGQGRKERYQGEEKQLTGGHRRDHSLVAAEGEAVEVLKKQTGLASRLLAGAVLATPEPQQPLGAPQSYTAVAAQPRQRWEQHRHEAAQLNHRAARRRSATARHLCGGGVTVVAW